MTRETQEVRLLPKEVQQQYPGGRALGLYLYQQGSLNFGIVDPLGTENLFVITPSLSTGITTQEQGEQREEGSYTLVTKSPLTDRIAVDTMVSPFGVALRSAGWDGLVIRGMYPSPGIMEITPRGAQFHLAKSIWKYETTELRTYLDEQFGQTQPWGCLGIGTAGALAVPVANLTTRSGFTGRGGFGAVLGAKQVKAIVAHKGVFSLIPTSATNYTETLSSIEGYVEEGKIPLWGGAKKELTSKQFNQWVGPLYRFQKEDTSKEVDLTVLNRLHKSGYSADTLLGLGTEIDNTELLHIEEWSSRIEELGLDPRSIGHILAWAMDADRRDLRNSYLHFGEYAEVPKAIEYIGAQRGIAKERDLGLGVRWLRDKFKDTQPIPSVDGGDLPAIQLPWKKSILGWVSSGTVASLGELFYLRQKGVATEDSMTPEELWSWERIMVLLDLLGLPFNLVDPLFMRPRGMAKLLRKRPSLPVSLENHRGLQLLAEYASSLLQATLSGEQLLLVAERTLLLEQQIQYSLREIEGDEQFLYSAKEYQKLLGLVGGEATDQQLHRLGVDELFSQKKYR